jgi:hypothetical protein
MYQHAHTLRAPALCALALASFAMFAALPAAAAAPTISGTPPATATVGVAYSWTPTVADADKNPLTLTLSGKPAWASFDSKTGRVSGTPTAAYAASTSTSRLNVSDGTSTTSLRFSITVGTASSGGGGSTGGTNGSPVISGTPPSTASVGVTYSWTPVVSDPNSDPLTLSLSGKPAWAAFDAKTGRITGTPSASYAGTTTTSKLNASDGKSTTTLRFSIAVSTSSAGGGGTGVGAVTLNWTPPTRNTDGSTLTNLAGYRITYGKSASALTSTVQISNPGIASYVIDNLASGTWYFALKVYTSAGTESALTNIASKTIP